MMIGKLHPVRQLDPEPFQGPSKRLWVPQTAKTRASHKRRVRCRVAVSTRINPGFGFEPGAKDGRRRVPQTHLAFDRASEIAEFATRDHHDVSPCQRHHGLPQAAERKYTSAAKRV